tara:strand:+ start:436 stop:900 length:465 start_codon:yes stop_codon:yes gene_type:complete
MFSKFKNHNNIFFYLLFFILVSCKLQDPYNNHGIIFLKNRSDKLVLNVSNKNDVIKIFGQPHSKAIDDTNEWLYIERTLTKGEYHKLGQNILKSNNILVLKFNKYGILKKKTFLDKNDKKKISFSKSKTKNELTTKSFVERFLSSLKEKMYSNR